MAKKKKGGGIRKAIKAAGPNISRSEMKSITKAAGGNIRKAINQISKSGANLASGAANMLIKQQQKAPAMRYDPKGPFGTSKIGQALQQMAGSPSSQRYVKGQVVGQPATSSQTLMGGTVIRPGGKVAVKKRPAQVVTQPAGDETTPTGLSADDVRGILDEYLNTYGFGAQEEPYDPMMDYLSQMGEMFSSQMGGFQQSLSDQMALMNQFNEPERFFGAGQNYYTDAVRAAQRNRQRRTGYLRGDMGIGGKSGVTAGAPTSGLSIGPALGVLGGVTG